MTDIIVSDKAKQMKASPWEIAWVGWTEVTLISGFILYLLSVVSFRDFCLRFGLKRLLFKFFILENMQTISIVYKISDKIAY